MGYSDTLPDEPMNIPSPLRKLYDAWMAFAHVLGRIVSFILLTVLWIAGFGAYAVAWRIAVLLRRKPQPATFWVDPPPKAENDMLHQF